MSESEYPPEFFASDCKVIRQSTGEPVMTVKTHEDALYLVRAFNRMGEVEDQCKDLVKELENMMAIVMGELPQQYNKAIGRAEAAINKAALGED